MLCDRSQLIPNGYSGIVDDTEDVAGYLRIPSGPIRLRWGHTRMLLDTVHRH